MNILFLTMSRISDISEHDIYQDLMRSFVNEGHSVYVVTPVESRYNKPTTVFDSFGCKILRVKIGNQSNCGNIEKGISLLTLRYYYIKAIKKHLKGIDFDLLLYSTPPITVMPIVKKFKNKFGCVTYLMLKDIFPQNAVDLGVIKENGLINRFFCGQEKKLYKYSDYIGCMSPANIEYLKSNKSICGTKVELCPNAVDPVPYVPVKQKEKETIRKKYGIPDGKILMVYGGNIGRPQGIPSLAECLKAADYRDDFYFFIAGEGTEYSYLQEFLKANGLKNTKLISRLPRKEYFEIVKAADVGLISLDKHFTIPNFPSRLLPYMEYSLPVFCVTDSATDVGDICEANGFGWKCLSGDVQGFMSALEAISHSDLPEMGQKARSYLESNYTASRCHDTILEKLNDADCEDGNE